MSRFYEQSALVSQQMGRAGVYLQATLEAWNRALVCGMGAVTSGTRLRPKVISWYL
jgi:hypothetical protein